MSKFIATSAIRGAHGAVKEADELLQSALKDLGPDTKVAFVDSQGGGTGYYLPTIYGLMGHKVETLGDLVPVVEHAKSLVAPVPADDLWLPYLGETLDAGAATLYAFETIEGVRFARGEQPETKNDIQYNGPINDAQMRKWGVQLVDGTMPGFAALVGAAKTNEIAVKIVRECQAMGQLVLLFSDSNGKTVAEQLAAEGVEMGYDHQIVPFGSDTVAGIYALGFATRAALSFGGIEPGDFRKILLYNKFRCFAFVLALGPVDDRKYAAAAGAINFGFPVFTDTVIPNILPTGVTQFEHVVSMPFDDIPGKDDMEKTEKLIQKCTELRGIKVKIARVPIPVSFGPAFEGEIVRRADLACEFGGKGGQCFEWLEMKKLDEVEDGKIEVIGPDLDSFEEGSKNPLGIKVDVAGRKMQKDFEPVLERQIHHMLNGAESISHQGQRDITWIRLHKNGLKKGLRLRHFGDILHTCMHNDFGAIVDKIQITLHTEPDTVSKMMEDARAVYRERNARLSGLTDEAVDVFYSCTLCQSFAPTHVCVINPERVGLCGAYSWLDCRASNEINPNGPNQPVAKGTMINETTGEWEGVNKFIYEHSQKNIDRFTIYSLMDAPMTTCGCCECVMSLIPEVNGVMIVSRDDYGMTPSGMTFTTLMATIGGGQQTPGMMGHGKTYIPSRKFISTEGGIKRLVWLSKNLKEEMAEQIQEACEREGVPDLMDKIADGTQVTTVEELMPFLEEKGHPALTMDPII